MTSSNAMELEGLKRCFNVLDANRIEMDSLITDHHMSVQKYMRENRPMVKHYYDIWHMAKCKLIIQYKSLSLYFKFVIANETKL